MSKPSVLIVGVPFPPGFDKPVPVPWSKEPVNLPEELKQATAEIEKRGYTDHAQIQLPPPEILATLPGKLKEKTWDAVIIGGGLKTVPELVGVLEKIVNITKDVSPSTRVMFVGQGPLSILQTLDRLEKILA